MDPLQTQWRETILNWVNCSGLVSVTVNSFMELTDSRILRCFLPRDADKLEKEKEDIYEELSAFYQRFYPYMKINDDLNVNTEHFYSVMMHFYCMNNDGKCVVIKRMTEMDDVHQFRIRAFFEDLFHNLPVTTETLSNAIKATESNGSYSTLPVDVYQDSPKATTKTKRHSLKEFLDSPVARQQKISSAASELRKIKAEYETEKDRRIDLEMQVELLQKALKDEVLRKEQDVQKVKERYREMLNSVSVNEPQTPEDNSVLRGKMRNLQQQITEYENKCCDLEDNVLSLQQQLKSKEQEMIRWRDKAGLWELESEALEKDMAAKIEECSVLSEQLQEYKRHIQKSSSSNLHDSSIEWDYTDMPRSPLKRESISEDLASTVIELQLQEKEEIIQKLTSENKNLVKATEGLEQLKLDHESLLKKNQQRDNDIDKMNSEIERLNEVSKREQQNAINISEQLEIQIQERIKISSEYENVVTTLDIHIAELEARKECLEQELRDYKERDSLRSNHLKDITAAMEEKELETSSLRSKLSALENEIEAQRTAVESKGTEICRLTQEKEALGKHFEDVKESLEKQATELLSALSISEAEIQELKRAQLEKEDLINGLNLNLEHAKKSSMEAEQIFAKEISIKEREITDRNALVEKSSEEFMSAKARYERETEEKDATILQLQEEIVHMQTDLDEKQQVVENLHVNLKTLQGEHEDTKRNLTEKETSITQLAEEKDQLEDVLRNRETKLKNTEEQLIEKEGKLQKMTQALDEERTRFSDEFVVKEKTIAQLTAELENKRVEFDELKAVHLKECEERNTLLFSRETEISLLKTDSATLQKDCENLQLDIEERGNLISSLQNQLLTLQDKFCTQEGNYTEDVAAKQKQIRELRENVQKQSEEYYQLQDNCRRDCERRDTIIFDHLKEITSLKAAVETKELEACSLRSKLSSLENEIEVQRSAVESKGTEICRLTQEKEALGKHFEDVKESLEKQATELLYALSVSEAEIQELKRAQLEKIDLINGLNLNLEHAKKSSMEAEQRFAKEISIKEREITDRNALVEKSSEEFMSVKARYERETEEKAATILQLQEEIVHMRTDLDEKQQVVENLHINLKTLQGEHEDTKRNLTEKETSITQLAEEKDQLEDVLRNRETKLKNTQEQLTEKEGRLQRMTQALDEERTRFSDEFVVKEKTIAELTAELENKWVEFDELKAIHLKECEEKNTLLFSRETEISLLKKDSATLQKDCENLQSDIEERGNLISSLQNQLLTLQDKFCTQEKNYTEDVASKQEEIQELRENVQKQSEEFYQLQDNCRIDCEKRDTIIFDHLKEITSLKAAVETKELEACSLRSKLSALEKELEVQRSAVESKGTEICRLTQEKEALGKHFEDVKESLEKQATELLSALSVSEAEIQELKRVLLEKIDLINGLNLNLEHAKKSSMEAEQRFAEEISIKEREITDRNALVEKSSEEFMSVKARYERETEEKDATILQLQEEIVHMQTDLDEKQQVVENLHVNLKTLQGEHEDTKRNLTEKETSITQLAEEKDQLEDVLRNRERKLKNMQEKLIETQHLLSEYKGTLQRMTQSLDEERIRFSDEFAVKEKTIAQLTAELVNKTVEFDELKAIHLKECEEKNTILFSRETEISLLKKDSATLQKDCENLQSDIEERGNLISSLQNQLLTLQDKFCTQEENYTEVVASKQEEIRELRENVQKQSEEFYQLQDNCRIDCEKRDTIIFDHLKEMTSLKAAVERKELEACSLRNKLSALEKELEVQRSALESKGTEICRLTQEKEALGKHFEDVKESLEKQATELLSALSVSEAEIQELKRVQLEKEDLINGLNLNLEHAKKSSMEAEQRFAEEISIKEREITDRNALVEKSSEEFMSAKARYERETEEKDATILQLQEEIVHMRTELSEKQQVVENLHINLKTLQGAHEDTKRNLMEKETSITQLAEEKDQLEDEFMSVKSRYEREIEEKGATILQLQEEIVHMRTELSEKQQVVENLHVNLKTLQGAHEDTKRNLMEKQTSITQLAEEKDQLEDEFMSVKSRYEREIEEKGATILQLQEEIVHMRTELSEKQQVVENLHVNLKTLQGEHEDTKRNLMEKETSITQFAEEKDQLEDEFMSVKARYERETEEKDATILQLQEEIAHMQTEISEKQQVVENLHVNLKTLQGEHKDTKWNLMEKETSITQLAEEKNQLEDEFMSVKARYERETEEKAATILQLQEEIVHTRTDLDEKQQVVENLHINLKTLQGEHEDTKRNLTEKETSITQLAEEKDQLEDVLRNRETKLKNTQEQLIEKEGRLQRMTQALDEERTRFSDEFVVKEKTIAELTAELENKRVEFDELKAIHLKECEEKNTLLFSCETEISLLKKDSATLQKDCENLQSDIEERGNLISSLQNQLLTLQDKFCTQEKNYTEDVASKQVELNLLRETLESEEKNYARDTALQEDEIHKLNIELEKKTMEMLSLHDSYRKDLEEKDALINCLTSKIKENQNVFTKLSCDLNEINRIKDECERNLENKDKAVCYLLSNLTHMRGILQELTTKYRKVMYDVGQIQSLMQNTCDREDRMEEEELIARLSCKLTLLTEEIGKCPELECERENQLREFCTELKNCIFEIGRVQIWYIQKCHEQTNTISELQMSLSDKEIEVEFLAQKMPRSESVDKVKCEMINTIDILHALVGLSCNVKKSSPPQLADVCDEHSNFERLIFVWSDVMLYIDAIKKHVGDMQSTNESLRLQFKELQEEWYKLNKKFSNASNEKETILHRFQIIESEKEAEKSYLLSKLDDCNAEIQSLKSEISNFEGESKLSLSKIVALQEENRKLNEQVQRREMSRLKREEEYWKLIHAKEHVEKKVEKILADEKHMQSRFLNLHKTFRKVECKYCLLFLDLAEESEVRGLKNELDLALSDVEATCSRVSEGHNKLIKGALQCCNNDGSDGNTSCDSEADSAISDGSTLSPSLTSRELHALLTEIETLMAKCKELEVLCEVKTLHQKTTENQERIHDDSLMIPDSELEEQLLKVHEENKILKEQLKSNEILKGKYYELKQKYAEKSKEALGISSQYEDKLMRLKEQMRVAYNEGMDKLRKQHAAELADCEKRSSKLIEKANQYHSDNVELRSQVWDLSEKFLKVNEEKTSLQRQCSDFSSRLSHYESLPDQEKRIVKRNASEHQKTGQHRIPVTKNIVDESVMLLRRRTMTISKAVPQGIGQAFPPQDEDGEEFNAKYLQDMKAGRCEPSHMNDDRLSVLQYRNSLCPPHLKSSYPAETQYHDPRAVTDEDVKFGLRDVDNFDSLSTSCLIPDKQKKKDRGQTSYKKPGPPTPGKNGARLSLQEVSGGILQEITQQLSAQEVKDQSGLEQGATPSSVLKESNSSFSGRKAPTPSRLRMLFAGRNSRRDENSPATPRSRGLTFFKKPSKKPL